MTAATGLQRLCIQAGLTNKGYAGGESLSTVRRQHQDASLVPVILTLVQLVPNVVILRGDQCLTMNYSSSTPDRAGTPGNEKRFPRTTVW